MSERLHRLAIILSHPVQYYSPWFQWLKVHTSLEFRVFYLWDFGVKETRDQQFAASFKWDLDLLSGYDHEFVPNVARDPGAHHFRGLNNPGLTHRLAGWRPGVVLLFGYNYLSHQRALWWARRHGVPLLFRGDSHFLGRGRPALPQRWLLQFLYRRFAAITYVGTANREYFLSMGVPASRLFFAPHSVNAARFNPSDSAPLKSARQLRAELGLTGKRVVLFAGKFSAAKQPLGLLRAFHAVATDGDALVFVGDGPLKDELVALAQTRPDRLVRFLPFANQSEMPARYCLADIFTLPSRGHYETWGLAVNEAIHLGVPCLVSDLVGCQSNLVIPGETGWVFRADDSSDIAATLARALGSPAEELRRLGEASCSRVSKYTYVQTTAGLLVALASIK